MALKDEEIFHPTESLILKHPRRHYRATVSPIHWQLRSLIGVSNRDIVYYPTGHGNFDIKRLNTTTQEVEAFKRVPFSPRCLVVAHGWLCCGGEHGEFASIRLDDSRRSSDLRLDFEPDERLPLDNLDTSSQLTGDVIFSLLSRNSRTPIGVKGKTFGKERVNCITLWNAPSSQDDAFPGAYHSHVAILANNDKHVTTVDLESDSSDALDEITYPDCVNRAVISPDGRFLIAICDDPYLYVHERVEKEAKAGGPFRVVDRPEYKWKSYSKIHLKGQKKGDDTNYRGSFAACFSSTGKYLAVGTQYGMICIFDVSLLHEPEEALMTNFASSSAFPAGAVREMSFCPGPFDLLAWSEDQGVVGVADVRAGFISRQVLRLSEKGDFEHIVAPEKDVIDPQLLESRSNSNNNSSSSRLNTRYPTSAERESPRSDLEPQPAPFTTAETEVLDAIQEDRRRRDQRDARSAAHDFLGSRPPWATRPSTRSALTSDSSRSRERSASVSRVVTDLLGNVQAQRQHLHEAHQRLRDHGILLPLERDRAERDRDASRRIGSGAFSRYVAEMQALEGGGDTSRESREGRQGLLSRILANPRALGGGWDNLEALYSLSVEGAAAGERPRSRDGDTESNTRRDRATFVSSLINQVNTRNLDDELSVYLENRRRPAHGSSEPTKPDDTSGLAWSEDGRILYIGAEDGIYEFHVNLTARKLYPSITMR